MKSWEFKYEVGKRDLYDFGKYCILGGKVRHVLWHFSHLFLLGT